MQTMNRRSSDLSGRFRLLVRVFVSSALSALLIAPPAASATAGPSNLAVLDSVPNKLVPDGVAVNPVTHRVYVVGERLVRVDENTYDGEYGVGVFDGDGHQVAFIPIDVHAPLGDPELKAQPIAVDSERDLVYVVGTTSPENENVLVIIDGDTLEVDIVPMEVRALGGVVVNESLNRIYFPADSLGIRTRGQLAVVDGSTHMLTTVPLVDFDPLGSIALDPRTNDIFMPGMGPAPRYERLLGVVERASVAGAAETYAVSMIPTGFEARGVAVDPSSHRVYLPGYSFSDAARAMLVVDRPTNEQRVVETGIDAWGVAVDPVVSRVYVAGHTSVDNRTVLGVLDRDGAVIEVLETEVKADGVAVDPTTERIYITGVTAEGESRITVVGPAPALPDLDVTNATVTNATGGPPSVTVTATVTNSGTGVSEASTTSFSLDGSALVSSVATPEIPPGGSVDVTVTMSSQAMKGEHTILITADETELVAEADETNNTGLITMQLDGGRLRSYTFE